MANKRHKPEEIVQKLRRVDVLVGQGMQRVDAIREVRISAASSWTCSNRRACKWPRRPSGASPSFTPSKRVPEDCRRMTACGCVNPVQSRSSMISKPGSPRN